MSEPTNAALARPWAAAASDVLAALGVDVGQGLSAEQATTRLDVHGPNELRRIRRRSAWRILGSQFRSVLVALLAAACVAAMAFGEWIEAGAILAVVVINAALGFGTELQAERSIEALRKLGATQAAVRRAGRLVVVPAAELVPGDIVVLTGGDVVTADLRLVDVSGFQVSEAALTGESLPVDKTAATAPADSPLGDRSCMAFKGTVATRGSATGVVVATGAASELGRISDLVEHARHQTTPLEKRLDRLGRTLVWVALAAAAVVTVAGYASGTPALLIIETAIALAVAAVPEGLPIIATVALARGVRRMARRNAIVNRLSAVETLGATNVICTDKTGTLTENRIEVERFVLADVPDARRRANEVGALCCTAALEDDETDGIGDPLEIALLRAAARDGVRRESLTEGLPLVREVAFASDAKKMATVHGARPSYRVAVKGAPEAVLAACDLAESDRAHWLEAADAMAAEGLRVLALADKQVADADAPVYERLTFLGLAGLRDAPRKEARNSVEACRRAGVRVIMVTGDHPATAWNIARATGLVGDGETAVASGSDLDRVGTLTEAERDRLRAMNVVARVSPEQKLDLIALHQAAGNVVAMTGDGVNDAPALRRADIGVAMGRRGTAAAKEAAAMVLADDDLSTIAVAIAEGRVIFDNIRSFVVYLLSCNLSEVLIVALAVTAGTPLPLLPLQILFLNLVTDVFPALALGVGAAADDVMDRPPRGPDEPVLTGRHWRWIVAYGLLLTGSVLGAFGAALRWLELPPSDAVTVSFLALALGQLWHVLNMRQDSSGLLRNEVTANPWTWAAMSLCVGLVLAAVHVSPVARILALTRLSADAWTLALSASLVPLVVGQLTKSLAGARRRRALARQAPAG